MGKSKFWSASLDASEQQLSGPVCGNPERAVDEIASQNERRNVTERIQVNLDYM